MQPQWSPNSLQFECFFDIQQTTEFLEKSLRSSVWTAYCWIIKKKSRFYSWQIRKYRNPFHKTHKSNFTIPQNKKIKPISQGSKPTNPKKKKRAKGIKSAPFKHKPPYNHWEKKQNSSTTSTIVGGVGTIGLNRRLGRWVRQSNGEQSIGQLVRCNQLGNQLVI